MNLDARIAAARAFIDALLYPLDETISATVADGWSVEQARAGFACHQRTWDIDLLVDALQAELAGVGGLQALDRPVSTPRGARRVIAPRKILHVWPALPGAGLTPMLAGWLLGAQQSVRASSRGTYFATHALDLWRRVAPQAPVSLEFEAPGAGWQQADVVVISGSDETVDAVRAFLGQPTHRGKPTISAYGHRVSAALVIDHADAPLADWAAGIARDVVIWGQQGCFSARAVVFCGAEARARRFAAVLASAIQDAERELGPLRDPIQLARRAQARGVAEFTGEVFGGPQGGWVQLMRSPWTGDAPAPRCVSIHPITGIDGLAGAIAVRPNQLQGCALATLASGPQRAAWLDELAQLGFTRVCAPGQLQSPPASWLHDGLPNVMDWVRVMSVDP